METIKKILLVLFMLFFCLNVAGQRNNDNDILSDSIQLEEFIYINTHYPLIDFVKNIEGSAVYQFDTDSIGRIHELQLVSSSGSSTLDWEARRLIYEIPMQKRGKYTTHKISINFKLADNCIYSAGEVEVKPEFPGGDAGIFNFLSKNLKYPPETTDMRIEGRVLCGFVVEKDGTINIVEILRPLYYLFDAEVMRVIKRMPKWEAGKKDGKPVRTYFICPVNIRMWY